MDDRFNIHRFLANATSTSFTNQCNSTKFGFSKADAMYCADTNLRLDSPGCANLPYSRNGMKRRRSSLDGPMDQKVEWSLGLCLGYSSSPSESKENTATVCPLLSIAKETGDEFSMDLDTDFTLHLAVEKSYESEKFADINLKSMDVRNKVDLQLCYSSGISVSDIATPKSVGKITANGASNASKDSQWSLFPMQNKDDIVSLNHSLRRLKSTEMSTDFSSGVTTALSSVTCSSEVTHSQQQCCSNTKQCKFLGCLKGARGASGLCIAHGGGRRCQRHSCSKGAEGRTALCKAHGGGRRCQFLGCTKSAEGQTHFCIAHGGGKRCNRVDCTRAARGKSDLCIRHGGGKRCKEENCTKSAESRSGLCIGHGGGRRCRYAGCAKGAQGNTKFCKGHGGGKRCAFHCCNKSAEGSTTFCKGHGGGKRCSFHGDGGGLCPKSVHGGTLFCVAHGGGKRCAVPECTKSARGSTDFCVRHGGGKRCKSVGCGKSAQGSTDFCRAHGGGKMHSWECHGHPSDSFASPISRICSTSGGSTIQDRKILDDVALRETTSQDCEPAYIDVVPKMEKEGLNFNANRSWFGSQQSRGKSSTSKIPEGRVHGGNLMAVFAHSYGFNFSSCRDMVDNMILHK